jgi:hypothetical protein
MSHLKENATIRGALKELIEGNGWVEVVCTLDLLLSEPDSINDRVNPEVEDYTVPMGVSIEFPRRRTLSEEGEPPQLIPREN